MRRMIVKIGSSTLVGDDGAVRRDWLDSLAADLRDAREVGTQVVVVTSGAIALGARRLGLPGNGRATLEDAQAAASVGQIELARSWAEAVEAHGVHAAQVLLTLDDLDDRRRYLNLRATLERLLALGAVPVLNENDSVATAEIRFGDNDRLAARVGVALQAGEVVLLSDVDGLYSADPERDPKARLVTLVERLEDVAGFATSGTSALGSGGMAAKIAAARIATQGGADLWIASGTPPHPLRRLRAGGVGTRFVRQRDNQARSGWLAGRSRVAGTIRVDDGAVAALGTGASLLAAGVTEVEGGFDRGELVAIADRGGRIVARGLCEYAAADLRAIAGTRSVEIAARLGRPPRAAVVHRNNMVPG